MSKNEILGRVRDSLKNNAHIPAPSVCYANPMNYTHKELLEEYKLNQTNNKAIVRESSPQELESTIEQILKEVQAKQVLEDFIRTYRDPSYTCTASSAQDLQDEIWKQRRIELWGEGFAMSDIMRLAKPVVRTHGGSSITNWPAAFAFNMAPDDPYLLLRFPQRETNANKAIPASSNKAGTPPVSGDSPDLRDGVTD